MKKNLEKKVTKVLDAIYGDYIRKTADKARDEPHDFTKKDKNITKKSFKNKFLKKKEKIFRK